MLQNVRIIIVCLIVASAFGCGLFSSNTSNDEVVSAPTEVGTPVGNKVTKDIGPAGGTLASPDGRLTLTVPQKALSETTTFSIQPITNKLETGLGLAYRLEPNGKTFETPVQISVRYEERDLEGTVPEAFSIAYQDGKGAWHAQKAARLDEKAKTLTITSAHFTDFAFLAGLRIFPAETEVYVGKSKQIGLAKCGPQATDSCIYLRTQIGKWKLRGEGTITQLASTEGVTYTAPAKKPSPNVVWVTVDMEIESWNEVTGELTKPSKTFAAKITIVDRGYRASGQAGDMTYSGLICDLNQPFTVSGSIRKYGTMDYKFQFTPSYSNGGTVKITGAGAFSAASVSAEGSGTYTIEGLETNKPRIAITASTTGHAPPGSVTGSGTGYIDLIPLETNECK